MGSTLSRKMTGASIVVLIAVLTVGLSGQRYAADNCSAGKPFCYDTPIHLDSPINTPGFEGGRRCRPMAWSCTSCPIDLVRLGGRMTRTSTSPGDSP
jgi:hypothetical protein